VSAGIEKSSVEQMQPLPVDLHDRLEIAASVVNRMGHDFNNVLTGVMGFLELAMAGLPSGSASGSRLREAFEAAQAGCDYVKQLLLFSRRGRTSSGAADLAALAVEEVGRCKESWSEKPELRLVIPDGLPAPAIEAWQARYLIGALLTNAFEALPNGEGTIVVSATPTNLDATDRLNYLGSPQSGLHAELVVEDNGTGFSAEARKRVFVEPFYTSKLRHRGLGLLTIYGILRNVQGGLRIEHQAGGGTKVHVLIPLAQRPAAKTNGAPSSTTSCPQGDKVLVVDDDPSMVSIMRKTLEGAGYQVCSAADGDEALLSIDRAAAPFNLVLSDVIMPRMSGFELADQIHSRQPQVPVLLTSGKLSAGFVPNRFAGRQYTLLPKPFRPDTLLSAVRAAMARGADHCQGVNIDNHFEDRSQIPAKDNSSSR
jgi:CheY-like chemotaxis protein/two-component sensor histidine kinase